MMQGPHVSVGSAGSRPSGGPRPGGGGGSGGGTRTGPDGQARFTPAGQPVSGRDGLTWTAPGERQRPGHLGDAASDQPGAARAAAAEAPVPPAASAPPTAGGSPAKAATSVQPGPPAGVSAFRRMKRSTRIAVIVIAVLALCAAAGFGASYLLYTRNYVSTDNAQVDGDRIDINAPMTGTLTRWTLSKGSPVHPKETVGRIEVLGSFAQPQRPIKSPGEGTVAVSYVVEGQFVTAGQELATGYDLRKIYITARVDETDIGNVRPGQLVDIDVDAYHGVPITGIVQEIQGAAAALFSLFPESNSSGNFQKVTQVIPVRIGITNAAGLELVPGMNVTVHIDKRTPVGSGQR
jgi:biotin carboxyl carrier protein